MMKQHTPILGLSKLIIAFCLCLNVLVWSVAPDPIVNVMAPLFIGDPNNEAYIDALNHDRPTVYEEQWKVFGEQLKKLKAFGVTGVSVDVWWGVVQRRGANAYDWGYYRR